MLTLVLFLSACSGKDKTVSVFISGDTIPLRYADNLTLVSYPDYTIATLRNPWDTLKTLHTYILVPASQPLPAHLPEGTIVRTPLRKSVIYSSVHCSLMDKLGAAGCIGGVCDLKYIKLPVIQDGYRNGTVTDCGDGMNPDMEKIIDLHPDAILLSPFENSGGYGRVEKLNIPIIECADYMETSALGRAEWMRFYGLLFGVVSKADSLFAEVDSCYNQLRKRASLSSSSLSIVSELKAVLPGMYRVVAVQSGVCLMMPAGVMLLRKINTAVPFLWLLKQFLTRLVMQMYGLLSTIETVI